MALNDGTFFTIQELADELGGMVSLRRVFDDDRTGEITESAFNSYVKKADSRIIAYASKNYPNQVAPATPAEAHPYMRTLALELCAAMCRVRWPSLFRFHMPQEALDRAERSVRDLSMSKTVLDGAPQAENTEASAVPYNTTADALPSKQNNDFGDF